MSQIKKIFLASICLLLILSFLHLWLNVGFDRLGLTKNAGVAKMEQIKVGFLPVTCHLTCPVTDWINKNTNGEGIYEPIRFNAFPEIKESIVSKHLQATFMLAPLAMALRQQGVPIKIVYLGHRDGTALVVNKNSEIKDFKGLQGKTIAIPSRYSNQYLIIFKGLKDFGLTPKDVNLVEMPPPDMPAALSNNSIDAYIVGEPIAAKAELDGIGRVLYQAKDLWPNFISCVLVAREDLIDQHPEVVQRMVDGIAKSGKWLDQDAENRFKASDAVAKDYYNQDPKYLRYVLTNTKDRVTYTNLRLAKDDFQQIEQLAIETGILKADKLSFEDYTNVTFSDKTQGTEPYNFSANNK